MKKYLQSKLVMLCFFCIPLTLFSQNPIWTLGSRHMNLSSQTNQPLPIPTFAQFQQRFGTGVTQQMYDDNMQSPWPRLFYNGGQTHSANQAIANEDGLLQFFIIDENIYDCEGFCIGYLDQNDAHGGGVGGNNDKTLGS